RSGRLLIDRLATVLGTLSAQVGKTTLLGKALELLVDRVTQHSKHSVRTISEIEIVQAGTLDHRAEQTLHLHAKQAVVHAEQLVKVDGGQIHLG
ncbi:MAG: DUF3540 domain-containing protein, partial [Deltaproteobacteria bacterium]|nr:DUF3540 domain-containing protein [Deltaproteobacteria bacterium]